MGLQRVFSFLLLIGNAPLAICQGPETNIIRTCISGTRCFDSVDRGTISVSDAAAPDRAVRELVKGVENGFKNRHAQAETHFRKALGIYPEFDSAVAGLAESLAEQGKWKEAERVILLAMERSPNHPALLRFQANIDQHAHRYGESVPILKRVLALEPHSESALVLLARAEMMTGDCNNAVVHARAAHLQRPHQNSITHLISAMCSERLGQLAEAQKDYELFLKEESSGAAADFARKSLAALRKEGDQ